MQQTTQKIELVEGQVSQIPLELIDRDENQPRTHFDSDWLKELGADIKKNSVQQPVTLRPNPKATGRYIIVYGENRVNASRLVKMPTVPALLYKGKTEGKTADLELLLSQVKENTLRKELNAMDWAHLFHTMNKEHGMTQPQIEASLKKHGVGNYGRSYISNIIMLRKLPDWAQEMVRNETITPAHGKYLLPAMVSEEVSANIKTKFESDEKWTPTVRELQNEIYIKFVRQHDEITGFKTNFDYKKKCIASGCKNNCKISADETNGIFCLDKKCYSKLQAKEEQKRQKAIQRQKDKEENKEPVEVKADKKNRVDTRQLELCPEYFPLEDAEFNKTECENCPHNHIAISEGQFQEDNDVIEQNACFNEPCFDKKEELHSQATRTIEHHMLKQVVNMLKDEPALALRVMAWIASDCPDGIRQQKDDEYISFDGSPCPADEEDFEKILFKHQLFSVSQFLTVDEKAIPDLLEVIIIESWLSRQLIEVLWKRFKYEITDFKLDVEYINTLREKELRALVENTSDLPPAVFADLNTEGTNENIDSLRKKVISHLKFFKAPVNDLHHAYQTMTKEGESNV